jgi:ureidoacrylate peracid hydrolase
MPEAKDIGPLGRERTALLIIDMQNSSIEEKGALGRMKRNWQSLRERLLAGARKAGIKVIHAKYVFQPDYSDGGVLIREIRPALKEFGLCQAGTWDAEIVPSLTPIAGEQVVEKNRPSAFYSTQLESFLRAARIENVVVCGVTTNMCVESTVRDASQRDFRTYVVGDACGEMEQDRHDAALVSMGFLFARVVGVNDVLDAWDVALANA